MKRFYSFSMMSLALLGLFFLVSSCNSDNSLNESSPEVGALSINISANDAFDVDENGVVTVIKQMTDARGAAIGAELRFAYPNVEVFEQALGTNGIEYKMDDFVFVADYADTEVSPEPVITTTSLETILEDIKSQEITRSLGYVGIYSRGAPADESLEYPLIDLRSMQTATQYGPIEKDFTDSNCPLLIGCSGDCAFTQVTPTGTWLYTGDCRRAGASSLWVCYCHTTKATWVPKAVGVGLVK